MSLTVNPMQLIEAKRISAGLSIDALAAAAGVDRRWYYRLLTGEAGALPKRATVARLKSVMSRLAGKPEDLAVPRIRMVFCTYQMALALVCERAGVSTARVHAQDPARRATADKEWLLASTLRRQAIYLLNCALGVDQADIAKAIGLTPAAVSLACRAVEDAREAAEMERLLDELTRTITGEPS